MIKPIGHRKIALPLTRALLFYGVFIIGLVSSARADSIYEFSGPFTGSFTVPQPLPPNQAQGGEGITITPTSFSFSVSFPDGTFTIPESGATSVSSFFQFITDSKSEITDWVVQLAETKGDVQVEFQAELLPSDEESSLVVVLDNGVLVEGGGGQDAGNWGGPFPVSEPSTLPLLGAALLGIACAARRERLT